METVPRISPWAGVAGGVGLAHETAYDKWWKKVTPRLVNENQYDATE